MLRAAVEILALASAGGFPTQSPAQLIDRDLEFFLPPRVASQPKHGGRWLMPPPKTTILRFSIASPSICRIRRLYRRGNGASGS